MAGFFYDEAIKHWQEKRTDLILGYEYTPSAFLASVLQSKGSKYRIYIGRTVGDINFFVNDEQCINSGTITNAFSSDGQLYIELDEEKEYYTENFVIDRIQAIYSSNLNLNQYYIVYKDNSYFKISIY